MIKLSSYAYLLLRVVLSGYLDRHASCRGGKATALPSIHMSPTTTMTISILSPFSSVSSCAAASAKERSSDVPKVILCTSVLIAPAPIIAIDMTTTITIIIIMIVVIHAASRPGLQQLPAVLWFAVLRPRRH